MREKSKAKKLYTAVLEFEGTTAVRQFRAATPEAVLKAWLRKLASPESFALTEEQAARLSQAIEEDARLMGTPGPTLTALDHVVNVWCLTPSRGRHQRAEFRVRARADGGPEILLPC